MVTNPARFRGALKPRLDLGPMDLFGPISHRVE
jgi:hypothetical protein